MCKQLDPERISRLIAESLSGSLSEEESEELKCWAEKSPQNRQLLELLRDTDGVQVQAEFSQTHDASAGWQQVERRFRRRRIARVALPLVGVAAAVALMTGIFLPKAEFVLPGPVIAERTAASAVQFVRASGEVIAVDTIRTIDLTGAVVESNSDAMTVVSRSDEQLAGAIAYHEVMVPESKHFEVTLADGTHVTLNACSKLRFPDRFSKTGAREVFLTGEAFFDVAKDAEHPFIVHAGDAYVRVTGTAFNVNCYEDTPSLVTTLVEGRVLVGGGTMPEEVALTPGMQAVKDRESGAVTTSAVDMSEALAWRSGLFAFREKPLKEILKEVGRWYGCQVVYENPTRANVCFTGKIAQASTLAEVAGFFSRTGEVLVIEDYGVLVIR